MRYHLVSEIQKMAEDNSGIYVVTGDLGYNVLNDFQDAFPQRFINAGICEQNMTAVAAGIALEGNTVYTYSIGNFPGMRCLEQIRNDVCYHNANVKIVIVGGGFAYGQLGMSHHATEDLAIMRALPNMRVFCPADAQEATKIARAAQEVAGPCYIRLAKGNEPDIHPELTDYDVYKILPIYEGGKTAVISTGSIAIEAKKAACELKKEGIDIGCYNIMAIKPLDEEGIRRLAMQYDTLITLEEHNIVGGLGGAVAEVLASMKGSHASLVRMGLQDEYTSIVGSQAYLREHYGMSSDAIIARVKEIEQ